MRQNAQEFADQSCWTQGYASALAGDGLFDSLEDPTSRRVTVQDGI